MPQVHPGESWSLQGRLRRWWLGPLIVAGVALASSVSGLRNHWAQDDTALVELDTRVHSLDSLPSFFTSSYWPPPAAPALYRPFSSTTLAFQWAMGGGNPMVFRLASYLLYALVSLAVLMLARWLMPLPVAIGVAAIFAAHPVHVESVALAVNQGEQWVGLLSIVATLLYLDRRQRGFLSAGDWMALLALYVTAFLFKEHALIMPGFLLAAELTLLRGTASGTLGQRFRNLLPGYAVLTAVGTGFMVLRSRILGDFAGTFTAEALTGQGLGGRTLTMLQVVPRWLGLLIWPSRLQGDYSPSVINQATTWGWPQTLGAMVLAGVAVLLIVTWRRAPVIAFGILWAGGALVPVANLLIPTGIVLAERTLFLPSVGFVLTVGGLAAYLLAHRTNPKSLGRLLAGACAVLTALGVGRSAARHPDWQNQAYFWAKSVHNAPLSYRAHHAHAQVLWMMGYQGASVEAFHTAYALYPRAYWILNELANRFRLKGDCYPALDLYAQSLNVKPDQPAARASRIACLVYLARYEEAIDEAEASIAIGVDVEDFVAYRATADSARRTGAPQASVQLPAPQAAVIQ